MHSTGAFLEKHIIRIVGENLDWFFKRVLNEHYEKRRQVLGGADQSFELIPAIDYILKTCVDDSCQYPPESVAHWHEYFLKLGSGYSHVFQQLLIMYLRMDITNYLETRARESTAGRQTRGKDKAELTILNDTLGKLTDLSRSNDFTMPLIKLSQGLWAMDNDQLILMLDFLSHPLVQLSNYFDSPKDLVRIIVGTIQLCGHSRLALYMSRVHRNENWNEDYDQMYAYLLLDSGQIIEALKYERTFMDSENYHDILQRFFELCARLDVIKSLNCLNLSIEEEEVLNQHHIIESSRPVTPSPTMHQTRRVTISEPAVTPVNRSNKTSSHTPRNRSVQKLRKLPSFSDSPARNTRSARKKTEHN